VAWIQPVTVVKIIEEPTRETSVADILLGAVGLVGFVLVAAALVGVLVGTLFFAARRASLARRQTPPGGDSALNLSAPDGERQA
jgi:hypothetical protein